MPNLLRETIQVLASYNLTPKDVEWCGSASGEYFFDWKQFATLADVEYHSGYGSQEVARDLVVVGKDWWLSREEYNGKEWWRFNRKPQPSQNGHLLPSTLLSWYGYGFLGEEENQ